MLEWLPAEPKPPTYKQLADEVIRWLVEGKQIGLTNVAVMLATSGYDAPFVKDWLARNNKEWLAEQDADAPVASVDAISDGFTPEKAPDIALASQAGPVGADSPLEPDEGIQPWCEVCVSARHDYREIYAALRRWVAARADTRHGNYGDRTELDAATDALSALARSPAPATLAAGE